jgi:dipeptidyl aminopeptidase/acylaminoacyl peptidase
MMWGEHGDLGRAAAGAGCAAASPWARPLVLRLGLLLLGLLLAVPVNAGMRELRPGELPRLRPDQGLLALAVDSSLPLQQLEVRGQRWTQGRARLGPVTVGRSVRLFVARAGSYRWDRIVERDRVAYPLGHDPEYHFEVRPGVLNYPGELVFRPRGSHSAMVHVANRGLAVLDTLDRQHPGLADSLPFVYDGHYPDPFPDFYLHERAGRPLPQQPIVDVAPSAGVLPLAIEALWRPASLQRVSLSPDGALLALVRDESDAGWSVELIDLQADTTQPLLRSPTAVRELGWSGERSLVVGVASGPDEDAVYVLQLRDGAPGRQLHERLRLPRHGRVLDLLPRQHDRLLFASRVDGRLAVHRIDIASQAALDSFDYRWDSRLNLGVDGDHLWLTDGRGRLRAVQAPDRHGASVLYHGADEQFQQVARVDDEQGFEPLRLSADGSLIYGLTEQQRAQRELVALDPSSGRMETVYARPGADIVAPVFDPSRRLLGATYFEGGRLVTHYFDAGDRALDEELRAAFPEQSVGLLDRDRSGRHLILAVEGSDRPAAVYHLDRQLRRATLLEDTRPWLAGQRFAPTHLLRPHSVDGLQVEAYLTLPEGDGRRPLVVMPHGGPIGIRDQRHFDPEVQFIASLGYAVLQVNFRGSAGFGRAFREAGHGELGRLIESDIDVAIATALEQYPLDDTRVCMLGASYGGYSALVSALRWPGRFRCVGSLAGFNDRILQFTASDSGRSPEVRQILETFMGDPRVELERMLADSPIYRYRELDLPVLLAHGTEDLRVDYEHTRRLLRMLNLAGRTPTVVTLYGEGHGLETPRNRERLWQAVAGFLRRHLDDGRSGTLVARNPS